MSPRERLTAELAQLESAADVLDTLYALGRATKRDILKSENAMARVIRKLATLEDRACITKV